MRVHVTWPRVVVALVCNRAKNSKPHIALHENENAQTPSMPPSGKLTMTGMMYNDELLAGHGIALEEIIVQ